MQFVAVKHEGVQVIGGEVSYRYAIIDGYGEDKATAFTSIQASAQKLMQYIDANLNGKCLPFAVCLWAGKSPLRCFQKADIAKYAIVESTQSLRLRD